MRVERGIWSRWACCLAVAAGPVVLAGCREAAMQAAPPPPVVGVVEARRMTVPVRTTPTGTTRSLREVEIQARVRGFLTERHFEEGSFVKEGQLLFVIEEEPYQVALRSAQAKRAEAEANLRKANASKARESAQAKIGVDQAQLELARIEEGRQVALFRKNASPQQDVDQATAKRQSYEAQLDADRAELDQAKADYDVNILAAQARLDEAEAAVRNAELDLGYCRIHSPMDGRIGEALVKVGNLVGPTSAGGADTTHLASIQQLDPMGVDIQVSSRYLSRSADLIRDQIEILLTRPGLEGQVEHPAPGKLIFFDNTINPTTSTFLMRAEVPNPDGTLLPGEYVRMSMTIGQLVDAIVVPEQAVAETQAGPVVYVVDDEGKVAIQQVSAAQTYQGLRVVSEGLEPGRAVIVEGLQLVRPGAPVKAEPATLPTPIQPLPAEAGAPPESPAAPAEAEPQP